MASAIGQNKKTPTAASTRRKAARTASRTTVRRSIELDQADQIHDLLYGRSSVPSVGISKPSPDSGLGIKALLAEAGLVGPPVRPSFGFVRIATASPEVRVGNCRFNAQSIIRVMERAQKKGVHLLGLPELCVTGYSCADFFLKEPIRRASAAALEPIRKATKSVYKGFVAVGAVLEIEGNVYNCAIAMQGGKYLGVVPKSYLAQGGEFDEGRWFKVGIGFRKRVIKLNGQHVRMGTDLLFEAEDFPGLVVGIEVCEDGWGIVPPHRWQALAGATVLFNLSASNELVGKPDYRRNQLVLPHSAHCMAFYGYCSIGAGESTGDMTLGGHCLNAENGALLAESLPFAEREPFAVSDVDIDHLLYERIRNHTFRETQREYGAYPFMQFDRISFKTGIKKPPTKLERFVDAYPFVPSNPATRDKHCREVYQIQVAALEKRMTHLAEQRGYKNLKAYGEYLLAKGEPLFVLGVSGGLDSTWALIIACKMLDKVGLSRKLLECWTLPGFGTTNRTYDNAIKMMKLMGVTMHEQDIRARCLLAWAEEPDGYKPFGIDVKGMSVDEFMELLKDLPAGSKDADFENKQARARTDLLMMKGFVLGTGDLSELAAGWCTYNADHMSMYGLNVGVPKTLIHFLVRWGAENEFTGELQAVFIDVAETEVSPELLPAGRDGKIAQKTNSAIGPADLRDFYLYHIWRWGSSPDKIVYLACQAKFNTSYEEEEIRKWLIVFINRLFSQRYKHSCLPDGSKVGSMSLSPRYDCHMPSDGSPEMYLTWAEAQVRRSRRRPTAKATSRRRPVKATAPKGGNTKRATKRAA